MKKAKSLIILGVFLLGMVLLKVFYDKNLSKDPLKELSKTTTSEINISKTENKETTIGAANNAVSNSNNSNSKVSSNKVSVANNNSVANDSSKIQLPKGMLVYDKDGKEINMDSFIGKKMLINVWASWCPPCRGEMKDLYEVSKEIDEDTVIIMINVEGVDMASFQTGLKYLENNKLDFKNVYFDKAMSLSDKLKINSIPTSIFVDREGNISKYKIGGLTKDKFKEYLNNLQ